MYCCNNYLHRKAILRSVAPPGSALDDNNHNNNEKECLQTIHLTVGNIRLHDRSRKSSHFLGSIGDSSVDNSNTRRQQGDSFVVSAVTMDNNNDSDTPSSHDSSSAWSACKDEIMIIAEYAHVRSLVIAIEESTKESFQSFKRRSVVNVQELLVASEQLTVLGMGSQQTSSSSSSSSRGTKPGLFHPKSDLLLKEDSLLMALEQADEIVFVSDKLYRYICCARALIRLRSSLNRCDWKGDLLRANDNNDLESSLAMIQTNESVHSLDSRTNNIEVGDNMDIIASQSANLGGGESFISWLFSKAIVTELSTLPCALAELKCAQQECRNVVAHFVLLHALNFDRTNAIPVVNSLEEYGIIEFDDQIHEPDVILGHPHALNDLVLITSKTSVFEAISTHSSKQSAHDLESLTLQSAIVLADTAFKVTSNALLFLIECARKLYTIRTNLKSLQMTKWASSDENCGHTSSSSTAESTLSIDTGKVNIDNPAFSKQEAEIIEVLTWFQVHGARCSNAIRQEIQRASTVYKNVCHLSFFL